MKSICFNVSLSDEQINQIAEITADKVRYSIDIGRNSDEHYESEIRIFDAEPEELT